MADVISLSSDSDNNEDSDVEIVGSYSNAMTRINALPLSSVRVDVNAVSVNVPSQTRYIDLTDQKWSLPDLKLGNRKNSNTFEVVDLTEINVENGTDSLPLEDRLINGTDSLPLEDCLINKTDSLPLNDCLINETENLLLDDCSINGTGNLPLDDCSINGTENLPQDDSLIKDQSVNKNQTATKLDDTVQKRPSTDQTVSEPQQDCGNQKSKHRRLDSETQHQKPTDKAHRCTSIVELRRLPFLETHATKLKTSNCSVHVTKDSTQMSLHFRKPERDSEAPKRIRNLRSSNGLHTETPADSPFSGTGSTVAMPKEDTACEEKADDDSPISVLTPCPTPPSSSQDKALDSSQRKVLCSDLEQLKLDTADSREGIPSDHSSSSHSPSAGLNPSEPSDLDTRPHTSPTSNNQPDPTQTSEHTLVENTSNRQSEEVGADEASSSPEPALSLSKTDDPGDRCGTGTYAGDQGIDSPMSFVWQEGSDGETVNADNRFDMDFREASREDMYVCPVQLGKLMSGPPQVLINEEDDEFGDPEVLCRQSLSLVYSTIDENYPEGTLQLLSDLLQPGYYPPRDITYHLLQGILLDLKCPYHLCVQAYNLLMRTQRHQMADNTTVAWDWELLTSVMANQRHRCEVLRMLLEYVVQTLEDDFKAKRSTSAVHHSIAKATLSCDQQFPCVRDIIKWLFSAIMKSTEQGDSTRAARERDEQIRMVSIFQRMLFLSLEVDRSPALNSAKLSQELFHMLIGNIPLRAHRMLLLGSLQSELLRCKLLEHLLDYACPLKISLPMSLSLLLHFLKNCTLAPDPTDGTERWHRWEELVHLLWMLLLSYNKAMKGNPVKGYLCSTVTEQKCGVGALVYRQDDMVSKPAVREAVEAFLSRSHADMGQALPLHVEESLTYLQDYLLDVCQC